MDENLESQENELLVLESIFEGNNAFKWNKPTGQIKVYPKFPQTTVRVRLLESVSTNANTTDVNVHEFSYLPPITLKFSFPRDYPSDSRPDFSLSCLWLMAHQIQQLSKALEDVWEREKGSVVIFEWYQFLVDETFSLLDIKNEVSIGEMPMDLQKSDASRQREVEGSADCNIFMILMVYDRKKKEEKFNSTSFQCGICFENKLGGQCVQMKDCNHVYCAKCLTSYFEVLITEGSVNSLNCPEHDCRSQALPHQVQSLVKRDIYARYERLLLQTTLDTMSDIIYCPLSHCQSPVILEQDENLAQCPACSFAFCVYCRHAYHGISHCKASSSEFQKIYKEYTTASPERRAELEKRYGRRALQSALDEKESERWLNDNTKGCPHCSAKIQKNDGCNKMTCYKCRTYFCWLCMQQLPVDNPYKHFNQPNKCFNRLFEGVDMDEQDLFYF